jgi:hypothetical protein
MAKRNAPSRSRTRVVARGARKTRPASRRRQAAIATRRTKQEAARPRRRIRKPVARPRPAAKPKRPAAELTPRAPSGRPIRRKPPAYQRARRTLDEAELLPLPPVTLDPDRHGSAILTGGNLDATREEAYHNGDNAPGVSNPPPDQEVVSEIGAALGIEDADAEELDRHEQ